MTIRAVFVDLGGVLVRTEYQAPREQLAQRLGMAYEELVKLVFESETCRRASLGAISAEEHWQAVVRALGLPPAETDAVRRDFFAGDILDRQLVNFLRSLRPRCKTGLISNAWPDLRAYVVSQGFDDAFDQMIISAEVGLMKPDARIYHLALEKIGVTAAEAVFLDDMPKNVAGAQAVGMHGVHFRETNQSLTELKRLLDGQ